MADNTICSIDIGSHSVYTIVARKKDDLLPQIIGVGFAKSSGIRQGVIVDSEEARAAISESVRTAERVSAVKISRAVVSIGGRHISAVPSKGVIAVSRADGEISADDIDRVISEAKAFALPNNREIIHVIPREFIVDGDGGIKDPLGMRGVRFEVDSLVVSGASMYIKNLISVLNDMGIEVEEITLDALASSKATLSKRQKELGVVCLDIGGGTTGVTVYEEGDLIQTSVVPFGGAHITNDLAIGLRIPVDVAENIKLEYGSAITSEVGKRDIIDLSYIDSSEHGNIFRREVCVIMEARLSEIFELANKELKKIGKEAFLPGGVVLVGGCAKIPHVVDLAKQKMRLPVQIGFPREVTGIVERVDDPSYATALGLIFLAMEERRDARESFMPAIPSLNNSVRQMQKWFRAFLP